MKESKAPKLSNVQIKSKIPAFIYVLENHYFYTFLMDQLFLFP